MYDLTADYMTVLQMATDPDIDPEAIADTLEAIGGEIEIKAENTAKVLKELEAEAAKLKSETERLEMRKKSIENNVKATKAYLYNAMKITGKEKFKTTLFSFNIQKNPVKLVIDDETKIPKKYFVPQPAKLDAAKLKEDLKAGAVRKYAHLEQGESLRIK
jgi:hypothetical protein